MFRSFYYTIVLKNTKKKYCFFFQCHSRSIRDENVQRGGEFLMDFHAAMETFAEAWVAANSNSQGQSQGHHETQVTNIM